MQEAFLTVAEQRSINNEMLMDSKKNVVMKKYFGLQREEQQSGK